MTEVLICPKSSHRREGHLGVGLVCSFTSSSFSDEGRVDFSSLIRARWNSLILVPRTKGRRILILWMVLSSFSGSLSGKAYSWNSARSGLIVSTDSWDGSPFYFLWDWWDPSRHGRERSNSPLPIGASDSHSALNWDSLAFGPFCKIWPYFFRLRRITSDETDSYSNEFARSSLSMRMLPS